MMTLAAALFWCMVQVTLLGLLTSGVYLGVRRVVPSACISVLMGGLICVSLLSLVALSPWPSWNPTHAAEEGLVLMNAPHQRLRNAGTIVSQTDVPGLALPDETHDATSEERIREGQQKPELSNQLIRGWGNIVPRAGRPWVMASLLRELASMIKARWRDDIAAVLGVAALIGILRFALGWNLIRRQVARSRLLNNSDLEKICTELRQKLGCRRTVQLRESDECGTAATVGWLQPVVLLASQWKQWSPAEQKVVLAHELAHITCGHFQAWLMAQTGLALNFYHPLIHWLSVRLRLEQEYEADALAAAASGGPQPYQYALASLALDHSKGVSNWAASNFFPGQHTLIQRMKRLQQMNRPPSHSFLKTSIAVAIILCGGVFAAGMREPHVSDNLTQVDAKSKISTSQNTSHPSPATTEQDPRNQATTTKGEQASGNTKNHDVSELLIIEGHVVDSNSVPVSGAVVVLPVNFGWGGARRDVAQTVSADNGTFSLQVPVKWLKVPYWNSLTTIWAYKPGLALGTVNIAPQFRDKRARSTVTITLPQEIHPEFRILDENGDAASNISVEPRHYHTQAGYEPVPQEILPQLMRRTDQNGRVTLSAIAKGKLFRVRVQSDRYGVQEFRADHLPDGGELSLRPAVRLKGQVIADNPVWVRNISLSFETEIPREENINGFRLARGMAQATTDAEGKFEIPQIAVGSLHVSENLDKSLPVRMRIPDHVSLPVEGKLLLPLVPATRVRGRVVRKSDGTAVSGAQVSIRYGHFHQGDTIVSDDRGEFEAAVLPGRVYQQVIGVSDSYLVQLGSPRNAGFEVPATDEIFKLPTIELTSTSGVRGTLVDKVGKPLANYVVWGNKGNRVYGPDATNANGEFELHLPVGLKMEYYGYTSRDGGERKSGRAIVLKSNPLELQVESQ